MNNLSLFRPKIMGASSANAERAGERSPEVPSIRENEKADEGAGARPGRDAPLAAQSAPENGTVEAPAPSEATPVGIYYITLGISTYRWLCAKHMRQRKKNGWTCKRTGNVEFECDDCLRERTAG